MKTQTEIESMLRERLNEIKEVPLRNPHVAARGRARFLTQAVAAREVRHRSSWIPFFNTRRFAWNMVVTLLVIAGLLVGSGTTVKAAQDDLPGDPLYAVKTFSEDVSLQFNRSPEAKVDRLMQLAEIRTQEMTRLIEAGQTPPEQVSLRLAQHLQQALQLCSSLDDATLNQKLPQLHNQLQQQEHDMQRLMVNAAQGSQQALKNARATLQLQLYVVDKGLLDHAAFRETVRNGVKDEELQTPVMIPSTTSVPRGEQNGQSQTTTQPSDQGNSGGIGPNETPDEPRAHVTPTPKNEHPTPGNNAGGNDKDKGKDKDKNKDKQDKTPKGPK
ncbi:MAG TPA: DUF5667 domain-containing protein [Anaerolineales bacterium]|nr:DUF5667 domain-containing protein [Anaerolineales bacterium]